MYPFLPVLYMVFRKIDWKYSTFGLDDWLLMTSIL